MIKKTIFILFYLVSTIVIQAQIDILPKTGASPEVAMLSKFENIPVSTYTGIPDINIPLYTIAFGDLRIPLVLRYNSSGIKVNEEATWVGLGWDLTVGGSITQIPIGDMDQCDNTSNYNYNDLMNNYGNIPTFNSYIWRNERGSIFCGCEGAADPDEENTVNNVISLQLAQPDNYSYVIPGGSGKFYLDPQTNYQDVVLFGNKNSEVFITKGSVSPSNKYSGFDWTLNDLNGIKYTFSSLDVEKTNMYPSRASWGDGSIASLSWKLSNILLLSGQQMDFSYTDGKIYSSNYYQTYTKYNLHDNNTGSRSPINIQVNTIYSKYLSIIETENEKIEFILSNTEAERLDLHGEIINGDYSAKRLNAIHIWDKISNKKIKTFIFNYNYFNGSCSSGTPNYECNRLKLESVKEVGYTSEGAEDLTIPAYVFHYNESYNLPKKSSYAVDYWGYYNGVNTNTGLLPKLSLSAISGLIDVTQYPAEVVNDFYNQGNADRGMDPIYATAGLLDQITYPTGGYLKLYYEANNFMNYPVLSAKETGSEYTNNYGNTDNKSCYGDMKPKKTPTFSPDVTGYLKITSLNYTFSIAYNNPTVCPNMTAGSFTDAYVRLMKVGSGGSDMEVQRWNFDSGLFNKTGTGYTYRETKDLTYAGSSSDLYYMEVSLGASMPCGNSGIPCAAASCGFSVRYASKITTRKSYGGGVRIWYQENYNADGKLASKRKYNYVQSDDVTSSGKLMSPLRFFSFQNIENMFESSIKTWYPNAYIFTLSSSSFEPLAYDANGAVVGYDRVEVIDEDNSSNINGKTAYYYRNKPSTNYIFGDYSVPNLPNEDNGLVDKIEYRDNSNQIVKTIINEYNSIDDKVGHGVKVVKNYIGPEECGWQKCQEANRWVFIYYPLQTRWYMLKNAKEILQNVVTERQFDYNHYGQLISETDLKSNNDVLNTIYSYPYNSTSTDPIISAMKNKNLYNLLLGQSLFNNTLKVSEKQFIYKENDNLNIKVYQIQQSNNGGSWYDKVSDVEYDNNDNVVQAKKDGIFTSYLWGYNQTYPVVKIEGKAYNESTTLKTAIGNHTFTSGITYADINTDIAWLKSQLSALQSDQTCTVTFYTYAPLVGMTSQTDSNGVTTYFEYDPNGRLKCLKDDDGKILKTYEYNYKH